MFFFDHIKRDYRELRLLSVLMVIGMCVLITCLWYLQIVSTRQYEEDQQGQATRTVRVPAVRGKILDRNGIPLAENRPVFTLDLYLGELSSSFRSNYTRISGIIKPDTKTEKIRVQRLARYQIVSNIAHQVSVWLNQEIIVDEEEFHRHFYTTPALPLSLLKNLSHQQVARFSEKPQTLPGLDLRVEAARVYPYQTAATHLLGYMKKNNTSVENEDAHFTYRLPDWRGINGLEKLYDMQLRGLAGTRNITVNYLGYQTTNTFFRDPDPGATVTLTIDLRLQLIAEKALFRTEFGESVKGAIVIMDPRNGDVLAMASAPIYNPHIFLKRISPNTWNWLNDSETRRTLNRATYEHYHPGSIFKIITALAALEAGQLDPSEEVENPGYWQWRPSTRPIADQAARGSYNFLKAFIKSSNTYFITLAQRDGVAAKIVELGQRLHLGERTGLIPHQDVPGEFPTPEDLKASGWGPGNTANLSIGQGRVHVTPLQMAVVTSAIANGGTVYKPRIASKIEPNHPDSWISATNFPPGQVRDYLGASPKNLHILHEAMREDVHNPGGTGIRAKTQGITIAGKTGTAEVEERGVIVDKITWFTSFAPVEAPRYVVVIMIESGRSGGRTCAPLAGFIYEKILELEQQQHGQTVASTQAI